MTRDLRPFGQALAGWMRKKGLSTKRLAELAGYKSKTSIVRILREECVQSGRERLFARISELGFCPRRSDAHSCRRSNSAASAANRPQRACACASC